MNKELFDENKKFLTAYIKNKCIERPDGYMFGKLPGARYSSQYYLANGLYNQVFLEKVCDCFYYLINENIGNWNFQLTGREWSSIPLLSSIPLILKLKYDIEINSFMIKRERKKYGKHNFIEGIPNDLPVMIVDDLSNSTNSFLHCHNVCTKIENFEVLDVIFSVLNKYYLGLDIEEDEINFDRYLKTHKIISIMTGDDLRKNDYK